MTMTTWTAVALVSNEAGTAELAYNVSIRRQTWTVGSAIPSTVNVARVDGALKDAASYASDDAGWTSPFAVVNIKLVNVQGVADGVPMDFTS